MGTGTHLQGTGAEVHEASLIWANSDAANTEKLSTITQPQVRQRDARYIVLIHNPSAESALSVALDHGHDYGAGEIWHELTTIAVAVGESVAVLVEGWLLENGRFRATNNTALSLSGGFTADVAVLAV